MKLRNKKTGEIRNAIDIDMYTDSVYLQVSDGEFDNETIEYHSLAELNEEWCDYDEPKEIYFISNNGQIHEEDGHDRYREARKEIGNYFETKEEAELAVRKLEAWKRLKDFGCGFIIDDHFTVKFVGTDATKIKSAEEQRLLSDAYKLLFGGEE